MTPTSPENELKLREVLPRPVDWKALAVLVVSALVLTGTYYFGYFNRAESLVAWLLTQAGIEDAATKIRSVFSARPRGQLWHLYYWVGVHTTFYLLVPALLIKVVFRERLRDYGLKIGGWYRRLWIYAAAFGVVLPLVIAFGATRSFQSKYPFYKNAAASWADFVGWELAYALQFFALEFFFRGFMIHGLKHRLGFYCVPVMSVPYCMIHFGKPLPETVGAIIAGLFLGTLSLWTRSIWLGFLIHVSVALSMDVVALAYRGELQNLWG